MKLLKQKKNIVFLIVFIIITIAYFYVPLFVMPDSADYYNYLRILRGTDPISSWGFYRGPSLPTIIYIGTLIFGDNMLGILATTYVFFSGFIILFYLFLVKILKELEVGKTKEIIILVFFYALIMFNPILFGYFHSFLTEFVGIFLGLFSCLFCWRWMSIDFFEGKLKYIFSILIFIFLFLLSWFLKQPFVTVILFPILIASLLSVITKLNWKNTIQRLATLLLCFLFLFAGIKGWNRLLENPEEMLEDKYTSNYYLSHSIINGLSNLRLESQLDGIAGEDPLEDPYISDADKMRIADILEGNNPKKFQTVKIMTVNGDLVDKMVLYYEGDDFSLKEAISFWYKVFRKHPTILLESYYSNYLATVNIYISWRSNEGAYYPIKEITNFHNENWSIGLGYTMSKDNFLWIGDYLNKYVGNLYALNNNEIFSSNIFKIYADFHLNLFKVLFGLLPFVLIAVVIKYLWSFKKLSEEKRRYLNLVIILLGFSFLHTVFHAVTGAIIDRYVYIVVPEIILAFMILFVLIEKKHSKVKKKV